MNKRLTVATALAGIAFTTGGLAFAQIPTARQATVVASDTAPGDEDIKLFRQDIRSLKKQIIAANIELTESEAQRFWPIYDEYTAEMVKIADKKFEVLKEYARNYNTLTDEQADTYIEGRVAVEESVLQLRLKYMPI